MEFLAGPTAAAIALKTSNWDSFYSFWVKPVTQLLIPLAIALLVLIAVTGLVTRFMVQPDAEAWKRPARWFWKAFGGLTLLAVATFVPIAPMFRPFTDGTWLTWAFPLGVVAPGVALTVLAGRVRFRFPATVYRARPGLMPWPTFLLLLLLWAGLLSCFFSWGARDRLLVAYVALTVLGITATATALGQNLRLQVDAQATDGTVNAAAVDYVLARLESLGSKQPDALGIARANELPKLLSEDLSAIPAGSIGAAIARIMYAIRPGLTWRARLTLVDTDRLTVTLTRNGLPVQSTVISRPNLGLPALTPEVKTPGLEEEQSRARAQLLTGASAFILVRLSLAHRELRTGLCGAKQWISVALQVIAGEPALMNDPRTRLKLLSTSVSTEPEYCPGRLDYLVELFAQAPKSAANRMRFAGLMDAQLPLVEEGQGVRTGYVRTGCVRADGVRKGCEVLHMRILYSRAAMRVNCYLMARAAGDQPVQQLRLQHGDVLRAANDSVTRLVTECTAFTAPEADQPVRQYAKYMEPLARSLQSTIALLTDEGTTGGTWTWTPPEPAAHLSPKLARHYAGVAELADEYGVPRGGLGKPLDYLAFAVATPKDREAVRNDPALWKLLHDPAQAPLIADAIECGPVGMPDLEPFKPYADKLTGAGITTFGQLRLRTTTDELQKALADYLGNSTVVVAYFADIAGLATTHRDLTDAAAIQVLLSAGITSRAELARRAAEDRTGLISALATAAERYGATGLRAFAAPNGWLGAVAAPPDPS